MPTKKVIQTSHAPAAIGIYSHAIVVGNTIYLSGQIGLDPSTMDMADGIEAQIQRVFENLRAVANAAGSSLEDLVKLNIYLTDMHDFTKVNEIMATHFHPPYPARAVVGVAALPRGALVEMDGILHTQD